jgi:hypothetical protein
VGPRSGLDDVEKRKFLTLPGLELRPLGHPACSLSLPRPLTEPDIITKQCVGRANYLTWYTEVYFVKACVRSCQLLVTE